jgi:hypothetical protein
LSLPQKSGKLAICSQALNKAESHELLNRLHGLVPSTRGMAFKKQDLHD